MLNRNLVALAIVFLSQVGFTQEENKPWWSFSSSNSTPAAAKRNPGREQWKNDLLLGFGTGMPIISGDLAWGLETNGHYRVSDDVPIFVGLEFGYSNLKKSTALNEASLNTFRINPSFIYRHPLRPKTYFYGGLVMGPSFSKPTLNHVDLNSETKLTLMMRPGIEFALGENFSLSSELRMGVTPDLSLAVDRVGVSRSSVSLVGSGFIIYPQLNALLRI